jgi:hypothetical protein
MTVTSRGREMICIVSVLVGLSLICVILRVFARLKRRVGFGMDDYLCFFSILLLIAMLIELALCKSCEMPLLKSSLTFNSRGHYWRQRIPHGRLGSEHIDELFKGMVICHLNIVIIIPVDKLIKP